MKILIRNYTIRLRTGTFLVITWSKLDHFEWGTNGRTDRRTDGRTHKQDGLTDTQTHAWRSWKQYRDSSSKRTSLTIHNPDSWYKKLSCRRQTARCFASFNSSLSHSRSLKVIENNTIWKLGYGFLFAFYSNYGHILYHFQEKARYWLKIAIFHTPEFDAPR